jgi:hypothetical protein
MSVVRQTFPRATEPDLTALAVTLAPLLAVAAAGAFSLSWDGANVAIEQGSFTGVVTASVQSAVTAAPLRTVLTDVDHYIDAMSFSERANYLTILDQVNTIRAALPVPLVAITPAQYITAVKAKAAALGS